MAIQENELGPEGLKRLQYALPGLNIGNLAQVWRFAQHLRLLQTSREKLKKSRTN
ncbi:unnamed protein product [marine sediment metagenome]|uniref:Uncharacterized protein n=2 Tax=marine sediment metagenome TaxID=412755 RepID=X1R8W2_9ZZZZ